MDTFEPREMGMAQDEWWASKDMKDYTGTLLCRGGSCCSSLTICTGLAAICNRDPVCCLVMMDVAATPHRVVSNHAPLSTAWPCIGLYSSL